jgi:hypothetical protein
MIRPKDHARSRGNAGWERALDAMEREPAARVPVRSVLVADSPRGSGEQPEHVQALAAAQEELPPIIVHRGSMRVIDGAHRLHAARLRGDEFIAVKFFEGDEVDAFVLAVKSNIAHGLPLSLADRKAAAARIMASHPQWSDRMIASVAGLAPRTIAEIRTYPPSPSHHGHTRVGRDGRVRPVDGAEGRRLAFKIMSENPGLSLRQVARAAGISPETARDVRHRLRRGDDPVPQRQRRERGGRGPRRERRAETPRAGVTAHGTVHDHAGTIERLRADPALRLTETGRSLLRLLQSQALKAGELEAISANVPPHCRQTIAYLAEECSGMWRELAERVEQRAASIT